MSSYGAIDLSGTIASAKGVAACRPRSLTVYGRSTQDGTPTPESPVAIESVDELALWVAAGKNLVVDVKDGLFINGATRKIGISAGAQTAVARVARNTDYVLSYTGGNRCNIAGVDTLDIASGDEARPVFSSASRVSPKTFNSGENDYIAMFVATSAAPASEIQLELGSTATAYEPHASTTTPIDLQGHALRSLPDGTRDELAVDAGGNVSMVRRVKSVSADTSGWTLGSSGSTNSNGIAYVQLNTGLSGSSMVEGAKYLMSSLPKSTGNWASATGREVACNQQSLFYRFPSSGTATVTSALADMRANGFEALIPHATVSTIDLGTVDLPTLPSPEFTAWTVDVAEFEIRALLRTGHTPVMWDGEELSAGWVFVSDRHEQLLPRNVTTIDVPGRDGAIFGGVTQAVRQLTLSLYVLGRPDERAEHVRELAARLAVDEPRPLRFGDELTRMAVPNADVMSTAYFDAEGWVDVTFECPDPWLYGEVMTETLPSGGTLAITVGGTAPTWPTITANATGGSQGSWIVTLEDGTGIYASIPSGTTHALTADCGARTLVVNEGVAMLPPSYDWPRLAPGTHTLTMAQGTGDATVTWVERWW